MQTDTDIMASPADKILRQERLKKFTEMLDAAGVPQAENAGIDVQRVMRASGSKKDWYYFAYGWRSRDPNVVISKLLDKPKEAPAPKRIKRAEEPHVRSPGEVADATVMVHVGDPITTHPPAALDTAPHQEHQQLELHAGPSDDAGPNEDNASVELELHPDVVVHYAALTTAICARYKQERWLQQRVCELEAEVATLLGKGGDARRLTAENVALKSENARLKSENARLRDELREQKAKVEAVKKMFAE